MSRLSGIAGLIATFAVLAVTVTLMVSWEADWASDLLLVFAALGLLLCLPYTLSVWLGLTFLAFTAMSLLIGDQSEAENFANLAYYGIAVGCLWALWGLAWAKLAVQMPLRKVATTAGECVEHSLRPEAEHRLPLVVRSAPPAWAQKVYPRADLVVGVACGLVVSVWLLATTFDPAQLNSSSQTQFGSGIVPFQTPRPTSYSTQAVTVAETISCNAGPAPHYYEMLKEHRPDILEYYVQQPWAFGLSCAQIYDAWLQSGQDFPPTTAAEYVTAQGWPAAAVLPATPTPLHVSSQDVATAQAMSCTSGATSQDYELLKQHRPDVLQYYVAQPWRPGLTCKDVYDDWLASGTEFPPTTAQAYVTQQGWLPSAPVPSARPRGTPTP